MEMVLNLFRYNLLSDFLLMQRKKIKKPRVVSKKPSYIFEELRFLVFYIFKIQLQEPSTITNFVLQITFKQNTSIKLYEHLY